MNSDIDHILRQFPYSGYKDQEQRLARLLLQWPENVNNASENSGINKRTMQKIRASWNDLNNDEQAQLLQFLSRIAATQLRESSGEGN